MPSAEYNKTEIAELGIKEAIEKKEMLRGLVEIAAYMDVSIGTVRNYIKFLGLPAVSPVGHEYITTTKTLINRWLISNILLEKL